MPRPAPPGPPARPPRCLPSASTGVAELLRGPVRPARVLMSLPAAVYLHVPSDRGGDVVGRPDQRRRPAAAGLRAVPPEQRPAARGLPAGAPAEVGGGRIVVGDLAVSAAAWWNPRPKLPSLRPALLPEGVRQLRNALYGEGVPHSAFTLPGLPVGPGGPLAALRGAVRRADLDAALRTATRLIGLGPGLTPAGDDVMAGTIAGLVLLGHPSAERFAAGVYALAAGRTTELSRALLRHAACGRVSGEYAAVLHGAGRRASARAGRGRAARDRRHQRPGAGPGAVHGDRPGGPDHPPPLRHRRQPTASTPTGSAAAGRGVPLRDEAAVGAGAESTARPAATRGLPSAELLGADDVVEARRPPARQVAQAASGSGAGEGVRWPRRDRSASAQLTGSPTATRRRQQAAGPRRSGRSDRGDAWMLVTRMARAPSSQSSSITRLVSVLRDHRADRRPAGRLQRADRRPLDARA